MGKIRAWFRGIEFGEMLNIPLGVATVWLIIWGIYNFLDVPGKHPILFWATFAIAAVWMGGWFYATERNRPKVAHSFARRMFGLIGTVLLIAFAVFVAASIAAALVAVVLSGDGAGAYDECASAVPSRYC